MITCLLYLFVAIPQVFSAVIRWDDLTVTWNASQALSFEAVPKTEQEAREEGFTMISDCRATPHFAGKRYVKDGDHTLILLYDINGYIAGIQAGIPLQPNGYPPYSLRHHPFVLYEDKYYITVYFRAVLCICCGYTRYRVYYRDKYLQCNFPPKYGMICEPGRTAVMFERDVVGTCLFIQNGTSYCQNDKMPHNEEEAIPTMWTKGKCSPNMGVHYYYNMRKDMSCDEIFPVFLLFNGGNLNAFGWTFNTDLQSNHYAHFRREQLGLFMDPLPDCTSLLEGRISTLHIYLTEGPMQNQC